MFSTTTGSFAPAGELAEEHVALARLAALAIVGLAISDNSVDPGRDLTAGGTGRGVSRQQKSDHRVT